MDSALHALIERVNAARAAGTALRIQGADTKAFYGNPPGGEVLDARAYAGVTGYEPTELVVTARCGTPLAELEAVLAEHGQWLPFEPPHYAGGGTVGGMVAAGLAGPARAAAGNVRDHVLGATLLNGQGEVLTFGGQVIKNVAGYDISRLLAGSMGVLGVILEVSLKVLPMASATATLRFEMHQTDALMQLNAWAGQPLPLNASAWWDDILLVRLRGALSAVRASIQSLGGEVIPAADAGPFWNGLRDHTDEFFTKAHAAVASGSVALWRLSLPPTAAPLALPGEQLIEWHGAQRWICTSATPQRVREAAVQAGGHATLMRGTDKSAGAFHPLTPALARIHGALKKSFDPAGIFNRGRLYPDF